MLFRSAAFPSDLLRPSPKYRGTSGFPVSLTSNTFLKKKKKSCTTTDPEELAEGKAMITSLYKEKAAPQLESKGGIASIEAQGETISEDGNSATVNLKIVYGNGSEENEDVKMVKVDEKWMLAFDK